jgi:ribosomal-protein-alanine N-acetyltransferase
MKTSGNAQAEFCVVLLNQSHPDFKKIIEIDHNDFDDPWSEKSWQLQPADYLLGCYQNSVLIGFLMYRLQEMDSTAHLLKICTRTNYRLTGAGDFLLKWSCHALKDKGFAQIYLEVRESNKSAIKLYKKNGFESIHRKKSYYSDGEDALIFIAKL